MRRITTALVLAGACFMVTGLPQGAVSQTEPDTKARLMSSAPAEASAIVGFWREAGPKLWFAKDPGFDHRFRTRFLELHEAAGRRELKDWTATAEGALALIILLDQFPATHSAAPPACTTRTAWRARSPSKPSRPARIKRSPAT